MSTDRDFNKEFDDGVGRKYAYGFDFDVMHHYMIEAFRPLLRPGSALELGSFKGDFTKRLLSLFDNITCVEASNVAIEEVLAHSLGSIFTQPTREALYCAAECLKISNRGSDLILDLGLDTDEPFEVVEAAAHVTLLSPSLLNTASSKACIEVEEAPCADGK